MAYAEPKTATEQPRYRPPEGNLMTTPTAGSQFGFDLSPVTVSGGSGGKARVFGGGGKGAPGGYGNLIQSLQQSDVAAKKATEERYAEAKEKMELIESIYAPGGAFGQGYAAYLASAQEKAVAKGAQRLVSSGLYGTTQAAGLETAWQQEVGAPATAEFQRMQMGQYAKALQGTAGLLERREDIGPDYGMIAQLMAKATA